MLKANTPTCTTCKALCNTLSASTVAVLASTRRVKLLQYIKPQHNMLTAHNEREIKIIQYITQHKNYTEKQSAN